MNNADTTISRWIAAHPDEIESSDLLSPDDNLDGYVVRRLIGKGSAGEVYEAWHPTLNASFAIKVYSPRNDTDVARLLAEGKRKGRPMAAPFPLATPCGRLPGYQLSNL